MLGTGAKLDTRDAEQIALPHFFLIFKSPLFPAIYMGHIMNMVVYAGDPRIGTCSWREDFFFRFKEKGIEEVGWDYLFSLKLPRERIPQFCGLRKYKTDPFAFCIGDINYD